MIYRFEADESIGYYGEIQKYESLRKNYLDGTMMNQMKNIRRMKNII
jgi:hypothetical protein